MKIIHTADWHIGKIVNEFSMLEDQAYFFDQLVEQVKELNADVLIMAGDLYDRAIPPRDAVTLANSILTRLVQETEIPILAIAGNHDSNERLEYGAELLAASNLYIEGLAKETVRKVSIQDTDFYLMPFADHIQVRNLFPERDIKHLEDATRVQLESVVEEMDSNRLNVLIMHGYIIAGNQVESVESSDSERPLSIGTAEYVSSDLFSAFDYVALGHLHKAQKVGTNRIRYSGSPLKYSKSETKHKKQVSLVTLEKDKEVAITPLHFKPLRDMRVVKGLFDDVMKEASDDYVFFELEDPHTIMEAMNQLRRRYPNAMGLEYTRMEKRNNQAITKKREATQTATLPELFNQYYETFRDLPLNDAQKQVIQKVYEKIGKGEDQ